MSAASPASPASRPSSADEAHLRISLHTISVQREDGAVEDDFKTWSEVVLLGGDGVPSALAWYAGEDANLARTSVTNGNEQAAYNYARTSKPLALTEAAVSSLVASTVVVRLLRGCPAPFSMLVCLFLSHTHIPPLCRSSCGAAARATRPPTRSSPPAASR